MKAVDFKRLVSAENLMLAWNRVSTAGNFAYKRYFRQVFYAYGFASAQNIADLHTRMSGGSFKPGTPYRLFVPKGAGLNRSITLLHVEDQIAPRIHKVSAPVLACGAEEERSLEWSEKLAGGWR